MIPSSELAELRADQHDVLPDTCVIEEWDDAAFDPDNPLATGQWVPIHTDVACRVMPWQAVRRTIMTGEGHVTLQAYFGTFEWDVGELQVGWRVRVTETTDPELVESALKVRDVHKSSLHTARRATLEHEMPDVDPAQEGS